MESHTIFDLCIGDRESILNFTHSKMRYHQLNCRLLERFLMEAKDIHDFLCVNKNAFTIEDIIKEWEEKLRILNLENGLYKLRRGKPSKYARIKQYQKNEDSKEILFEEIIDYTYDSIRLAKSNLFVPDNKDKYNMIVKIVDELTRYNDIKFNHKEECSCTDKKLISAVLYDHFTNGNNVKVCSRDKHVKYNMTLITEFIKSKGPDKLKNKLKERSLSIYQSIYDLYKDNAYHYNIDITFDSKDKEVFKRFGIALNTIIHHNCNPIQSILK